MTMCEHPVPSSPGNRDEPFAGRTRLASSQSRGVTTSRSSLERRAGARDLLRRAGARACRDRSGVVAIEFAFVAPIFLGFLLALLQIAVVWFAKSELQNGAEAAARLVLTGQVQSKGMTQAQFAATLCADLPIIFNFSGLMFNLQPQSSITAVDTTAPTLTYDSGGNVSNGWVYDPGTGGQIMVLQVLYPLPVIAGPLFNFSTQPNGTLLLVATTVFRNETQ
jgi:Flp pilus assembly protein TadG